MNLRITPRREVLGRFRLDPLTSRQIGHRVHLVQWRDGRRVLIANGAAVTDGG